MVNTEKKREERKPVREIYPFGRPKEAIPAEKGPVREIRLPEEQRLKVSAQESPTRAYDRVVQRIIYDRKHTLETDTVRLKGLAHELIDAAISQPAHVVSLGTKQTALAELSKMITQVPFSKEDQDGIRNHVYSAAKGSGQSEELKALLDDFMTAFVLRRTRESKQVG